MIKVVTNSQCLQEKEYIVKLIFEEFWQLPYELIEDNTLQGVYYFSIGEASIRCPDIFFSNAAASWLSQNTLPTDNCEFLKIDKLPFGHLLKFEELPILFGNPYEAVINENHIEYGFDILGTIFFVLSRYEEGVCNQKDEHERFAAKFSHAYKNNYLHRPIVNEYLELLWFSIQSLGYKLSKKERQFHTVLTCDVDAPYTPSNKDLSILIRSIASLLIKKGDFRSASSILSNFLLTKFLGNKYDKNNTFEYLMSLADAQNASAIFFFICDNVAGKIDGNYSLKDPFIKRLFSEIKSRGHRIGMHGSYTTFNNEHQLIKEKSILERQLHCLGLQESYMGNRQHYLRYDSLQTIRYLDNCGFSYDSTLSFADVAGFRCGTCYEYTMYDLTNRHALSIKQLPLIFMECSVIEDRYMGLGYGKKSNSIC